MLKKNLQKSQLQSDGSPVEFCVAPHISKIDEDIGNNKLIKVGIKIFINEASQYSALSLTHLLTHYVTHFY